MKVFRNPTIGEFIDLYEKGQVSGKFYFNNEGEIELTLVMNRCKLDNDEKGMYTEKYSIQDVKNIKYKGEELCAQVLYQELSPKYQRRQLWRN